MLSNMVKKDGKEGHGLTLLRRATISRRIMIARQVKVVISNALFFNVRLIK